MGLPFLLVTVKINIDLTYLWIELYSALSTPWRAGLGTYSFLPCEQFEGDKRNTPLSSCHQEARAGAMQESGA